MMTVEIYTDGACSGNPGPGGWAAVLIHGENVREISGFEDNTTNNKMELLAPIKALEMLKKPCIVELYTDSAYVSNAFLQNWLEGWEKNNWKKGDKTEVKNQDLWKRLLELTKVHKVNWHKVKGHADNKWNNRCDELAVLEIKNNRAEETLGKIDMPLQYELKPIVFEEYQEKTVEEENVMNGLIFDVERLKVQRVDGGEYYRDIVRHNGGAAVVAVDTDGGVFVVRQYRKPHDRVFIELPAGKLEKGEDPLLCAVRELNEEAGLIAGKIELLMEMIPSPAILSETLYLYMATDLEKGEQKFDDGEFLSVEKIHISTLMEMIKKGEIVDAKTVVAIMLANEKLKE